MSMSEKSTQQHKLQYAVDERVLCFHGPLIYEAKILDREWFVDHQDLEGPCYLVHYKGWKNTWDEWVPETRILRWNDANLETQQKLKNMYSQVGKKRRHDSAGGSDKDEDFLNLPEIRVQIPNSLKAQLVDDWENITKNQQLVILPRTPTVSQVLEQYKAFKRQKRGASEELLNEIVDGVKKYFNNALGSMLLYRFERHQYVDIRKQHTEPMSDIYGAEHLLRLFVQMPSLIAHTDMGAEATNVLTDYLTDIMRYMQRMQKQFFSTEYEHPTPEYVSLTNSI